MASRVISGVPHILILIRTQGGFTTPATGYGIVYFDGSTSRVIADIGVNDTQGAWNGTSSRLSVVREGDSFTVNATKFTGGSIAEFVYTLGSDPQLDKFRGPASFGFYTHSQPGSTYQNVSMPFAEGRVLAVSTNRVWEAQNGTWVDLGTANPFSDYLQWPRVAVNPNTNLRYYVYRYVSRKV
jgi:hypothetical protein